MRYPTALLLALVVSLGLFWLMQRLVAPPAADIEPPPERATVTIARLDPPPQPQQAETSDSAGGGGRSAPGGAPPVPGLQRPTGIAIPAPEVDADLALPPLDFEPQLSNATGMGSAFGGFAGTGGGAGGGQGGGIGSGRGDGAGGGRDLIPLSTARPQIPETACRRGIEGWARATFNVNPGGRVTNIKIIDAQPRGLFEQAMVESLQHWLYLANDDGNAYQVTWRFEFKLEDCKLNWRS